MKLLFLATMILLCSTSTFAGPCIPGTLQNYIALSSGGCTSGNALFKDFQIAPGQSFATPIAPAQILVSPGGLPDMPSLRFTLGKSAAAGQLFESFFHFDVSGPSLFNATVMLENPSATGDGAVISSLDICPNASFSGGAPLGCPNTPATLIALKTATFSSLSDSKDFIATSFFDVFVDLTIDGGLSGSATMDSATVRVTVIPEPASALLIIIGCGVLALARLRQNP